MATTQALLKDADDKMKKALETLAREFAAIRSGRATPALLEGVKVESYGTLMPLKQLASVSNPDPKLLVVQPWDVNLLSAIEKAIAAADLGVMPVADKKILRIPIPPLSAERREEFVKVAHKQSEASRVAVRNVRHATREGIEKLLKDKAITEDDKFTAFDDLEKLTHRVIGQVDAQLKTKETEIRAV